MHFRAFAEHAVLLTGLGVRGGGGGGGPCIQVVPLRSLVVLITTIALIFGLSALPC